MNKKTLAPIALILVSAGILILVFGQVLKQPNSFLFSHSEDAVKSYYNFSWYLKYDKGIRHDGINYPYGDHLQYINSHPLYVQILKFIDNHIFPVAEDGVGIMNLSMILSLLLAVPFLYLILRKFALPPWYAALISLIILFLSPQLDRIGGHFEMVYAFFIPLYWYLLIRWEEGRKRWLWGSLMLLTALVGGFTSAYIVAFLAVFPMAVVLVQAWNHRQNFREYLKPGLTLLAVAVAPLVIVKGLVGLTDWVNDRPDNPWGFFIFHSNIWSIFLPPRSIMREVFSGTIDFKYQWEGRAYVGFPPMLLTLGTALWIIYHLVRNRNVPRGGFRRKHPMNLYLAAGIIVLIFAMCFPFKWFRFLPEILPPLKQFRCLGRFSWIFYYIFSAYTALFIYRYFRLARRKGYHITALVVVTLLLGYWSLEAGLNVKSSTRRIFNQNQLITMHGNEMDRAFQDAGVSAEDYQAILFLPFANTCGDKLLFIRGMKAFPQAMKCGYQTGLPLVQSFSPRLSFTHAMSSIQMLADSTIFKSRMDDMDARDLLLLVTPEELNAQEQNLLNRSSLLWTGKQFSLYSLPADAVNRGHEEWTKAARACSDSLGPGRIRSDAPAEKIIYMDFEDGSAEKQFTGSGARYQKKGWMEIFTEPLYEIYGTEEVELSLWIYTDHRTDNMPTVELWPVDAGGDQKERIKLESRAVHNVDGLWVRVSRRFRPQEGMSYRMTVRGKYVTVDDLLVKPVRTHVAVMENDEPALFDNFRLTPKAGN